MPTTRHSLIARMRSGVREDDWETFYAIYERPLLALASSRSLNNAECQDVLQETMVKMLRIGFRRFDPEKGRFTGFLFHIAGCCVTDALRRRRHWQGRHVSAESASSHGEQLPDSAENPAEIAERQGQIVLLHTVLAFLVQRKYFQAKTVALFKAVTIEHLGAEEAARRFDTSVGNVYEARRVVLAKVGAVLQALDRGADLEEAAAKR